MMWMRLARCTAGMLAVAIITAPSQADVLFDPPTHLQNIPDVWGVTAMASAADGSVWMLGRTPAQLLRFETGTVVPVASVPAEIALGGQHLRELDDGTLCLVRDRGVWIFDTAGAVLAHWILPWDCVAAPDRDGEVFAVRDLLDWDIVVPDSLVVFGPAGEMRRSFALPPRQPGSVALAADGLVWILDRSHHGGAQIYSSEGALVREIALHLDWWGSWEDPRFQATPSGTMILLHPDGEYVRTFGPEGVLLCEWFYDEPENDWDGGSPRFAAEDGQGRMVAYPPYGNFDRIATFAPLGPGALVVPDADDVPYVVDGVSYTGSQRFLWTSGTTHMLSTPMSTPISPVTYRDFVSWGGVATPEYEFTVPPAGRGFRLNLQTYHWIETSTDGDASVTPSQWAPQGQPLTLTAQPDSGHAIVKWGHPDSTGWQPFDVLEPEWTHVIEQPETWQAFVALAGMTFTISASPDDPWVTTAPPAMGPRQLWLWAVNLDHGLSALEADAAGSLVQFPFVPEGGVLNVLPGPDLLCAIPGCPVGPDVNLRLGSWWVIDHGGDFCLQPSAASDVMGAAHCPSLAPQVLPIGVVGFSSIGAPCLAGTMEPPNLDPNDTPEIAGGSPAALALAVRGNPFRAATALEASLPAAGSARLRLFDVTGRLVRTLWSGPLPAGIHAFAWDGRTDGGSPVPAGIYFARLDAPGGRPSAKLVRIAP